MVGDTGELAERFASGDRGGAAKKLVIEFTPCQSESQSTNNFVKFRAYFWKVANDLTCSNNV